MLTKFWHARWAATCSVCLMSSRLSTRAWDIDASLSDVVPIASRLSATNAVTSVDRGVEIDDRSADLVGIVGHQRGHRGQVVVELTHQVRAVVQGRHQRRQVLECGEYVVAVVAERRNRLRQLDDRCRGCWRPCPRRLSAVVLMNAPIGADAAGLGGLQALGEFL